MNEKQVVTAFNSPQLEDLANSFTTWLTMRLHGRLPAPHIRIVGASEEFWPFLRDPSAAINSTATESSWTTADACMFAFMAVGPDGEVSRLDRKTKRGFLSGIFPFEKSQIRRLSKYDAAVFLRLQHMPSPQHQIAVMSEECVRVLELWLSKPLVVAAAKDGPDPQVLQWLNEFAAERQRKTRSNDTTST